MSRERLQISTRITETDTSERPITQHNPEEVIQFFRKSRLAGYYVDSRTLQQHRQQYGSLRSFLDRNDGVLDLLSDAHGTGQHDDEEVTLIIIPEYPLILSQYGRARKALVPIVTCTLNALDDAWEQQESRGKYDIFKTQNPFMTTSGEAITKKAWEDSVDEGQLFFLNYTGQMSPEQYLAFPALGAFENEAYTYTLPPAPLPR